MDSHMKIPAVRPRIQYLADGGQTEFVFPFPVFSADDVEVYRNAALVGDGYQVDGVGRSDGGRIIFQEPPPSGERITLRRHMSVRRMTDFLQGSDMRADSFNDEFDRLTAISQELADVLDRSIVAPVHEDTVALILPQREVRRNKALVFNETGDLTVKDVSAALWPDADPDDPEGSDDGDDEEAGDGSPPAPPPPPTATATTYALALDGSVDRSVADRLGERASVRDFGAVGDGTTDDTAAFLAALDRVAVVHVPNGTFRITQPLVIGEGRSLVGQGPESRLIRGGAGALIDIQGPNCRISALRLSGGHPALRVLAEGRDVDALCVNDLVIDGAESGIVLETVDGHSCHRARIARVTMTGIGGPGLWFAGDHVSAPSAPMVRDTVISGTGDATGAPLLIEAIDRGGCFSSLVTTAAAATPAIRLGSGAKGLLLNGVLSERSDGGAHILVDDGAVGNVLVHHRRIGPGTAVAGPAGDGLTIVNGFEGMTRFPVLAVAAWRHDSVTTTAATDAAHTLDATRGLHLIDAANGGVDALLPDAGETPGAILTVKKVDDQPTSVTLETSDGSGPDGGRVRLADRFDHATVVSDGQTWRLIGGGRPRQRTERRVADPAETLNLEADVYLLDAPAGAPGLISLPNAGETVAQGRQIAIKMTGGGSMGLAVSEIDGPGPDGAELYLMAAGEGAILHSDGQGWSILART